MNTKKSQFTGGIGAWIGYDLLGALITTVTLGIAYPWAVCMKERWIAENTYIDGKKLRFDGTGGALLGQYIKWYLLAIVTIGIYSLWIPLNIKRWTVKHTHFADSADGESAFFGSIGGLLWVWLQQLVITAISLGICYPWALCIGEQWYASHTTIDGQRILFQGEGRPLLASYIGWCFLSVITFGIYSLWVPLKIKRWQVENTHKRTHATSVEDLLVVPWDMVVVFFCFLPIFMACLMGFISFASASEVSWWPLVFLVMMGVFCFGILRPAKQAEKFMEMQWAQAAEKQRQARVGKKLKIFGNDITCIGLLALVFGVFLVFNPMPATGTFFNAINSFAPVFVLIGVVLSLVYFAKIAHVRKEYKLAMRCYHGEGGMAEDKETATARCRSLAENGVDLAMGRIALLYLQAGEDEKAALWAHNSARIADEGKLVLAILYQEGRMLPQRTDAALYWYTKAAKKGNSEAQCRLGLWYRNGGNGVEKDEKKAEYWLRRAAARGESEAIQALKKHV